MPFSEAEEHAIRVLLDNVDGLTEEQLRAVVLQLREGTLRTEGEGLKGALPDMTPGIAKRALEALAQRHFDLADDLDHE